ncbi:MAG: hypothetical protein P8K79_13005 [Mariniblastus sp.]|nr:hypothetical protein [Mariniblastus sp.]
MASYAAAIHEQLGDEPVIETGRRGQLDIFVGNQRVISRKGGLWAMLTKKPWPPVEEVLQKILTAEGPAE